MTEDRSPDQELDHELSTIFPPGSKWLKRVSENRKPLIMGGILLITLFLSFGFYQLAGTKGAASSYASTQTLIEKWNSEIDERAITASSLSSEFKNNSQLMGNFQGTFLQGLLNLRDWNSLKAWSDQLNPSNLTWYKNQELLSEFTEISLLTQEGKLDLAYEKNSAFLQKLSVSKRAKDPIDANCLMKNFCLLRQIQLSSKVDPTKETFSIDQFLKEVGLEREDLSSSEQILFKKLTPSGQLIFSIFKKDRLNLSEYLQLRLKSI